MKDSDCSESVTVLGQRAAPGRGAPLPLLPLATAATTLGNND